MKTAAGRSPTLPTAYQIRTMSLKMSAVQEMARLRTHQSCISSCKIWGCSSLAALLAIYLSPIPIEYSLYKNILQLCFLLIAAASMSFVYFSGKQRTGLNSKQMVLLGLSESNIIRADQQKPDQKSSSVQNGSR